MILAALMGLGCDQLTSPFPSSRKVNLIVAKVTPPIPTMNWRRFTNPDCPGFVKYDLLITNLGPESFTSQFTFRETGGETWAHLQNFSIQYTSTVDGIDLSPLNFSGGINLIVEAGKEATIPIQTFSGNLAAAVDPFFTTYALAPIKATITFSGRSGVGDSFSVSANFSFVQFISEEELSCPGEET